MSFMSNGLGRSPTAPHQPNVTHHPNETHCPRAVRSQSPRSANRSQVKSTYLIRKPIEC